MICKVCNIDKLEIDFHFRKDILKYRKECKNCFNLKSKNNFYKNRLNLDFVESERKRATEKYYRLYSTSLFKRNKYNLNESHKKKYPEKYKAADATKKIRVKGFHCHHWNYNKEYFKDIIYLTHKDHLQIHRFLIYDEDKKIYKTIDNILLDTKEKHLKYINTKLILT
jgi:hypothetical protein